MLLTTLCEYLPEFNLSGVSHWSSSTSIFTLSYTQQPSCNLSHRYPLSSTQRYLTYNLHIAHAHAQQPCSEVTDISGSVAGVRWLGLRGYPYLGGILGTILKATTNKRPPIRLATSSIERCLLRPQVMLSWWTDRSATETATPSAWH